jgi:multidrug efflux system membrane fusion protein
LISKISQNEINNINIGDAAIVKYKDRSLFGKVSKIASTANTSTRTFDVEIIVKNEDLFLKGGMTLEIEITTDNILAYEMSPVHLSVNSDGVLYTKIVKNDEVTYKNVTIVNSGENLVNVTGLNDGDIVLTNGQAFVSLNDKIQYNIEN